MQAQLTHLLWANFKSLQFFSANGLIAHKVVLSINTSTNKPDVTLLQLSSKLAL